MATFNLKKNKQRIVTEIKTLDEIHTNKIIGFSNNHKSIPKKKAELTELKAVLSRIENSGFSDFTDNDVRNRASIKIKIEELTREINDIENNSNEIEYYSKTIGLINEYYSNKMEFYSDSDDTATKIQELTDKDTIEPTNSLNKLDELQQQQPKRAKKIPKKRKQPKVYARSSILNFWDDDDKVVPKDENKDINSKEPNDMNKLNSEEFETEKSTPVFDQSALLIKYNMIVNNQYSFNKVQNYINLTKCPTCNEEKTLNKSEAIYVCRKCGTFEMVNIEADKPSYKDVSSDKPGYPYKRINHFNEWLSQFQAKESYEIPSEIYNQIVVELHKNRIFDFKKLKIKQIKDILNTLSLATYYEHVVHIISKLSGLPPPMVDRATEEKLRTMFKMIQIPFENNRPEERINFLSYSFVLHKFCQLLDLDDYVKCFPLLKSRDKLRQQDIIWKGICKDLHWEYIPSI